MTEPTLVYVVKRGDGLYQSVAGFVPRPLADRFPTREYAENVASDYGPNLRVVALRVYEREKANADQAVQLVLAVRQASQKAHTREQYIDWAYGQVKLSGTKITRDEVARIYDEMEPRRGE